MKENYYIELMNCALSQKEPSKSVLSELSLREIYDFCSLNKLLPLGTRLLPYLPCQTDEECFIIENWKQQACGLVFLEYQKNALLKQLQENAESRNIPLIFFKGCVLADLYPSFTMRNSSDTDIYVDKAYALSAIALLKDLNYIQETSLDEEDVLTFLYLQNDTMLHKIELHTSLYEDLNPKQIAVLEDIQFVDLKNTIFFHGCNFTVRTLTYQNHLIYQLCHMAKHLCSHGFPARYLLDVALFIQKYHTEIHWKNVDDIMQKLGFQTLYHRFLSILIYHFHIPTSILEKEFLCPSSEISDLLSDILTFGMRSMDKEISHYFFYFEKYLEKIITSRGSLPNNIAFDGTLVPSDIVPLHYQENSHLQKRILLLKNLNLLE